MNEEKTAPRKPARFKKVIITLGVLFVVLITTLVILRMIYSDEHIKDVITKSVSEKIHGKCVIGSLSLSLATGKAQINDIRLFAKGSEKEFMHFDQISTQVNYLSSIFGRKLSADLFVDGLSLRITRMHQQSRQQQNNTRKKYTTNIHTVIAQLSSLPWKQWLGNVNWSAAEGEVIFERGQVMLEDRTGQLGACSFENIAFNLSRKQSYIESTFTFNAKSPSNKNGRFTFKLNSEINPKKVQKDKLLSFINNLGITAAWQELDAPYIMRYYGLGSKGQIGWMPGSPVDGTISLKAPQMSGTSLTAEISTKNIITLEQNGTPAKGQLPVNITINANADLSREWTYINNLQITSRLGSDQVCTIATRGSLEDSLELQAKTHLNTQQLCLSPIGQILKMENLMSGEIDCNWQFTWNRTKPWNIQLFGSTKDLVFKTSEGPIPAPAAMDAKASITSSSQQLQQALIEFNFKSDAVNIESKTPLSLSFLNPGKNSGRLFFNINMDKLSKNISSLLKAWSIPPLHETLTGIISLDSSKLLNWNVSMSNNRIKSAPITIKGSSNLLAGDEFIFTSELKQEQTGLHATIKADGKKSASDLQINFTQQLSANLAALREISQRFSAFTGNWHKDIKNLSGTIRQGTRGSLTVAQNNFNLKLSTGARLDNIALVTDDYSWNEKSASLATIISYTNSKSRLQIDKLELRTSAANINAKLSPVNLDKLLASPGAALSNLPEFELSASVGQTAFANLNQLLGGKLPLFIAEGKSLTMQAKSISSGKYITVNNLSFNSPHAAFKLSPFNFAPRRLSEGVTQKNYDYIIKSFSALSLSVICQAGFWQDLNLPKGLKFNGQLKFAAALQPASDSLNISVLSFNGNDKNAAVIEELSLNAHLSNLSHLLKKPDLNSVIASLPNGINIPKARFSVQSLKEIAGEQQSNSLRALRGKEIILSDVLLKPKGKDHLTLAGNITANLQYFSKDAKWPLLAIDGTLALAHSKPFEINAANNNLIINGAVDFTQADIKFAALSPYIYHKSKGQPSQIALSMNRLENTTVTVNSATLAGGPLEVSLRGFKFIPLVNKEFILQLQQASIGQPFNIKISDLLMSKPDNLLRLNLHTSGIDFTKMNSQLALSHRIRLQGSLGPTSLQLQETYQRFFPTSGSNLPATGGKSRLQLGKFNLMISSTIPNNNANFGISMGGGVSEWSSSEIVINNLAVKRPNGFNFKDPVSISKISIIPDMSTLFSDRLVIDKLSLSGLSATYELAFGSSNISALQKNLDTLFPKSTTGAQPQSSDHSRKTLIREFELKDGVVQLSQTLLQGKLAVPVPRPPLRLSNIGGNTTGNTFSLVFSSLFDIIGQSGVNLFKGVGGAVGNVGKTVTKTLGKTLENTILLPFGKKKKNAEE